MQKMFLCCLAGGTLLAVHPFAAAQVTPTATDGAQSPATVAKPGTGVVRKAPAVDAPQSVTVPGERPTERIDRQVYDVKSDIGTSNGTAADALNNVPSVSVDPDGSVTLRGSSNVQIMIDGKPSAMLTGAARGAMLSALAAHDIESIEVINNPGAQFGNESGGGPILNLVMRRNRKPGGFGAVNANVGTAGRYNTSASGSDNEGGWGYQGGINFYQDGRNSTSAVSRDRLDPASGAYAHSSQRSSADGLNDALGLNGSVNYKLNASDTVSATASYYGRTNDQRGLDRYINGDSGGATVDDYQRGTDRYGDSRNDSWGGTFDHKGTLPGEKLKIDLRVSSANNQGDSDYTDVYTVASAGEANSRAVQRNNTHKLIVDFTGDYERPLAGGTAKLGYKLAENKNTTATLYNDIDPVTAVPTANPQRSNRFELDERTVALYATYQMRVNERWGALAGLRTEYTDMTIDQITGGTESGNNYVNYIPSAYATYKVDDTTNLRFSYAHRLRRPNAGDLNPYVTYRDEANVTSGNSQLKPTQTDSFEVGYETTLGGLDANLRGYYRRDRDAIVDYRYFISDTVLLTTRENGGGSHAGGLEFTLSGKLTPTLTLNASGNLARNQQTAQDDTGAYLNRTANAFSGRLRLNYQASAADQVQVAVQVLGRTLSGLGYRSPSQTLNASLRHKVTPQLDLVLNATDVFRSNKIATITDSPTLRETGMRRFDGRIIYVGLSYRFGGAAPQDDGKAE